MGFELILSNIGKHLSLTSEESRYFCSLLTPISTSKKTILLEAGQSCRNFFFVNRGVLRAFYTHSNGKEATLMFAVADWWITDMHSFAKQKPAMVTIESLGPTSLIQLSKENMDQLLLQCPSFERFFRIIFQKAYIREQLRVIENLSQSAEERYKSFISTYPYIEQLVPQKQIASYLGITPEFLSKMKKGNP